MTGYKTVYKWFWVWEFDKEEEWLNLMTQSGWLLDRVGFSTFHFIPCKPGEFIVRLEMHRCDETYIRFMQETGAEFIGRMAQWIYFRKKAQDGAFDIFSDIDSRIGHLNRIGKILTAIGGANLLIGIANSASSASHLGFLNILCATLLMYALGRIHGKKEALKKERLLLE